MRFNVYISSDHWEQDRYRRGSRKGRFKPGGHRRFVPGQVVTEIVDRGSMSDSVYQPTNALGKRVSMEPPPPERSRSPGFQGKRRMGGFS
jgi:hypothetical protein